MSSSADFYYHGISVESLHGYMPGGYHPVHLGDTFSTLPGSDKPRYRVLHKLGYGSFSTVWLAKDLSHENRCVALKIIQASLTGDNHELQILQWLSSQPRNHPGSGYIMEILDSFQLQGPNGTHEVIVTEVVVPLYGLKERRLVTPASKSICFQAMMALAYLHQLGITHGDLHFGNMACTIPGITGRSADDILEYFCEPDVTPVVTRDLRTGGKHLPKYLVAPISIEDYVVAETTILGADFHLKLLDFGNSFRANDAKRPPHTPMILRAPEVIFWQRSNFQVDSDWGLQSDIWTMGCTLYEICSSWELFQYVGTGDRFIHAMVQLAGPLPDRWEPYWDSKPFFKHDGMLTLDTDANWQDRHARLVSTKVFPSAQEITDFLALLRSMLQFEPRSRPSSVNLLEHTWFKGAKLLNQG